MKTSSVFAVSYPEATDHTRLWEHFETITTGIEKPFGAGAWQNFNPAWSSNTNSVDTALAVGNGTQTARWRQIGDVAEVEYLLIRGSTTNVGNGYYVWTLPVAAWSFRAINGTGMATTPSQSRGFHLQGRGGVAVFGLDGSGARIGSTNPTGWADQGYVYWLARYKVA